MKNNFSCSIMQPFFLPWAGYFNLIANSDLFVFLNDAQYQKGSWQNRNRVIINQKSNWITAPIKRSKLETKIYEMELNNNINWQEKMVKTIEQNYNKAPFFRDIEFLLEILLKKKINKLSELNIYLIKSICDKLEIETTFLESANIPTNGKRSKKLIEILEQLKVNIYISPVGSKEYLKEDNIVQQTDIKINFQEFLPKTYKQIKKTNFESHLSIVDVLANLGFDGTNSYIR